MRILPLLLTSLLLLPVRISAGPVGTGVYAETTSPRSKMKRKSVQKPGSRKKRGKKERPSRFRFDFGGGLSFPDSARFDSRGGFLARAGMAVYVGRHWTIGVRGQAEQFEWVTPQSDPLLPDRYRLTRLFSVSALTRILFAKRGTRPYVAGGIGVFKTDARADEHPSIYPRKGPMYPAVFGIDFELNPKWLLGVEYQLLFLEDRESHHVTQASNLALTTAFVLD